jgi:hypothetical protein
MKVLELNSFQLFNHDLIAFGVSSTCVISDNIYESFEFDSRMYESSEFVSRLYERFARTRYNVL